MVMIEIRMTSQWCGDSDDATTAKTTTATTMLLIGTMDINVGCDDDDELDGRDTHDNEVDDNHDDDMGADGDNDPDHCEANLCLRMFCKSRVAYVLCGNV
jgi:hypothetical protein